MDMTTETIMGLNSKKIILLPKMPWLNCQITLSSMHPKNVFMNDKSRYN